MRIPQPVQDPHHRGSMRLLRQLGSLLGKHVAEAHLDQLDRLERRRERVRKVGKLVRVRIGDFAS
jgi:hypothetical protein